VNKKNTCETDPISLYFDYMQNKFLSKTGAPYFQASGKIFQVAGSSSVTFSSMPMQDIYNMLPTKKTDVSWQSNL